MTVARAGVAGARLAAAKRRARVLFIGHYLRCNNNAVKYGKLARDDGVFVPGARCSAASAFTLGSREQPALRYDDDRRRHGPRHPRRTISVVVVVVNDGACRRTLKHTVCTFIATHTHTISECNIPFVHMLAQRLESTEPVFRTTTTSMTVNQQPQQIGECVCGWMLCRRTCARALS